MKKVIVSRTWRFLLKLRTNREFVLPNQHRARSRSRSWRDFLRVLPAIQITASRRSTCYATEKHQRLAFLSWLIDDHAIKLFYKVIINYITKRTSFLRLMVLFYKLIINHEVQFASFLPVHNDAIKELKLLRSSYCVPDLTTKRNIDSS